MKGVVSFHAADLGFFDEVVSPLVAGRTVNPEGSLRAALSTRRVVWAAARWTRALASLLAAAVPPEPDPEAPLWKRLRHRLEAFDFWPDRAAARARDLIEPDLHLEGRPFLITEGSAENVAAVVDRYRAAASTEAVDRIAREQLRKLDPDLAEAVGPEEGVPLSPDLAYRADVLGELREIHELGSRARGGRSVDEGPDAGKPALDVLLSQLPWRALRLHGRLSPFWIARDADGLETVCRAAGIAPPAELVPAWRLFAEACEAFPALREQLATEIRSDRGVGAFVAPADVPGLVDFLDQNGSKIIAAAARYGEGPACAALLRKVKECAVYASRRGLGYLEGSGLTPLDAD